MIIIVVITKIDCFYPKNSKKINSKKSKTNMNNKQNRLLTLLSFPFTPQPTSSLPLSIYSHTYQHILYIANHYYNDNKQ